MSRGVGIQVSANFDAWTRGFGGLSKSIKKEASTQFEAAAEMLYDRSQANVHVLSGDLRRSGKVWVDIDGNDVEAFVAYGNSDVDYAAAEHARGGSHAFLTRGWEATERTFSEALPKAWESVVARWR